MNIAGTIRDTASMQAEGLVNYLALRRDGLGISRQLLAQRLGLGEAELRAWEHGTRQPDLSQTIAWMVALGMNAVFAPTALDAAARLRATANNGDWIAELATELARDFAPAVSASYQPSPEGARVLKLLTTALDR